MNVVSVTQNLSVLAGGVRDAVAGLMNGIALTNAGNVLLGVGDDLLFEDIDKYSNINTIILNQDKYFHVERLDSRFGYIPKLEESLDTCIHDFDVLDTVIDLHGLWMYKSIAVTKFVKKHNLPLIVTPHGHIDEWALKHRKIMKLFSYLLYERRTINEAVCFRALCKSEAESIKKYFPDKPVAIIPNGIDVDDYASKELSGPYEHEDSNNYALYLARITQQKGLEILIKAWSKSSIKDNLTLVVAGPDYAGFERDMIKYANTLGCSDSIKFIGVLHGEHKKSILSNAKMFILPSHSEGFSMSLLEASASSLPILYTTKCNFPELSLHGGAIEVDDTVEGILVGLNELSNIDSKQMNIMGAANFNFVASKFTWNNISLQYLELCEWLIGKCDKPRFVE
jgi:glycosyltransferase involved in cell wall biosynthesis